MTESHSPAEEIQMLQLENQSLRSDVNRLNLELKKLSREMKITQSFLDKVTKTSEAKDTIGNALSAANAKQRAYMDMLLESCPNIIILFNSNGHIVLSTHALLTATDTPNLDYILNRSYEEVLSRYFSSDSMEALKTAFGRVALSNEIIVFDVWADFTRCGEPRYYSVELRHAGTGEDGVSGILAVMVDFTDIMREKQRAEAANNAKSEFLAAMSHEIRTPMNAIIGMSEMLARSELNERQKKFVSDICRSSNALLLIINDVLDFSMIEVGEMGIVLVNYNLKEMLDSLYSMFAILCREKDLFLEYFVSENLPEFVYGDGNRLRQVLTNLLSNAVKYTKKGGLVLSAWMDEGNILRFDVKDSGIGIREEDKSKLFKPFEQIDPRENKGIIGTGLGLAISYNLCKMMGGDLKLDSIYGEGSNFSVYIPFMQSNQPVKKEAVEIFDFTAAGAKVLVVDDIEINLNVIMTMLSAFEIVPDLASRGVHAIELAKNNRYDIIFMDHLMPEMDGLDTTKYIRALGGWNEKVPIIALTANAIDGMDKIFLNSRMDDYLFKPLSISNLNLCLKKWLPEQLIIKEEHK